MERLTPHNKLKTIEADIKALEAEKAELDVKYGKWPLSEFKKQIDHLDDQLKRQQENKMQVLNEIQYSLF